jgi:alkaline phosphatase D
MRIAFTSCFSATLYSDQPVWGWIKARQPDHLVLLGDSIYLDFPPQGEHPKEAGDNDFAQLLFKLYSTQIRQPQFVNLVQSMPSNRVWSIWDDHDFLWNDALGAEELKNPIQRSKVKLSTAFQEAFRHALANKLKVGSFPEAYNDITFWKPDQPALSIPSVKLANDVYLHLTDGRTYRTKASKREEESKRTLLGANQREQLGKAMADHPAAIHILASGSTLADFKKSYPTDWHWLLSKASQFRSLVLSGDIHRNESDMTSTIGYPLHEATSSGAAIRDAVVIGQDRRNYGLLDINADTVTITLYANDQVEPQWTRVIHRASWLV